MRDFETKYISPKIREIQLPQNFSDTIDAGFKRMRHADEFAEKLVAIQKKHGRDHEAASDDMGDAVRDLLVDLGYGEGADIFRDKKWYGG